MNEGFAGIFSDDWTVGDEPDLVECPTCSADMVLGGPCWACAIYFEGEDGR